MGFSYGERGRKLVLDQGSRREASAVMVEQDTSAEARAQQSADGLALALEDVGFDVGRSFPMLRGWVDREGAALIELGCVTELVATQLTGVLLRAAQLGVRLPTG